MKFVKTILAVTGVAILVGCGSLQISFPTVDISQDDQGKIQVYSLPGSGSGTVASFRLDNGNDYPAAINVEACPVTGSDGQGKRCGPFTATVTGPAVIVGYTIRGSNDRSAYVPLSVPIILQ